MQIIECAEPPLHRDIEHSYRLAGPYGKSRRAQPRGAGHLAAGEIKHAPVFCRPQTGMHIASAFAVAVRERVNDGAEDFRVAQVQLVQDRERVGVQAGDCLNANRGGLPRADIPVPTVGLSSSPYRRRA